MAFTTHHSIINGVREDDEHSWQRFFAFYTPLIRLAGRDFRVPEMYLDDLVQNVLLAIASGQMGTFCPSRGRFVYFLRGIIRNKSYELLRGILRQEALKSEARYLTDESCSPEDFSSEWLRYAQREIRTALQEELPPDLFQIFELLYLKNWPVQQVAQYLELPLSSVYYARKRILKKCRRIRTRLMEC